MSPTSRPSEVRVTDAGVELTPDPGRTIVRFFVPGREDVGPQDSRAGQLIARVLDLDDLDVDRAIKVIERGSSLRLPHLAEAIETHATLAAHRIDPLTDPTGARRRLLGAAFTQEYSIEGAALCNPSIVRHPQQPASGDTAFVLSVRGIGEGHRSSIGFRTGTVATDGSVTVDAPGLHPQTGHLTPGTHHRSVLHRRLAERDDDHENAAYVLDSLPDRFGDTELGEQLEALTADAATRRHTLSTIANLRQLASYSYRVNFLETSEVSARVLWPRSAIEAHGMEDARFVEITDGSAPKYCATYTAFDGTQINQMLLTTEDFSEFDVTPMAGAAARGKGLALFPRMVDGRYVALSRADRETNAVAFSDDFRCWDTSETIQVPRRTWELLQVGNCGSPIETPSGWLVLTHGVGVMRTYSIGAILLDLDAPQWVVAATDDPIVIPATHEGYVPNVVYTCGAMAIGDLLILPYGLGDRSISIATLSIRELVSAMRPTTTSGT